MTVSSSMKYAVLSSSTMASRLSVISCERIPSLPRLVSMLCDLPLRKFYPGNVPSHPPVKREPRDTRVPLPLPQLRLRAGLHRRLHALLCIGTRRGRNPSRERPFYEGRVYQPYLLPFAFGQHLEHGLSGEHGAAEVHENERLVGFEAAYSGFNPLRVRAEAPFGVAPDGRDLDLPRHLQDKLRGALGDLLAVRDEHDPDHQEVPSTARAAASRSRYVEVAPGS